MIRYRIFIFIFISATSCIDFDWDNDVVRKYSEMKLLSNCLGNNFLQSWKESVIAASEKCHEEQTTAKLSNFIQFLKNDNELFQEIVATRRKPISTSDNHSNSPVIAGLPSHILFMVPEALIRNENQPERHIFNKLPYNNQHGMNTFKQQVSPLQQNPLTTLKISEYQQINGPPLVQPFLFPMISPKPRQPMIDFNFYQSPKRIWWKRSLDQTNNNGSSRNSKDMKMDSLDQLILLKAYPQIEILKSKMASRVGNITCVLKHMELIDENGNPNYEHNKILLHHLYIPESLRNDILEAQDFCKDFSLCAPIERMANPLVAEIGNSFVFLKCMKKMIFHACMANDYVQSNFASKFSFGTFGRSSLANKLRNEEKHGPQDTVRELEHLLESQNVIGFGF